MGVKVSRKVTRSGAQAPDTHILMELFCDGCPSLSFAVMQFKHARKLDDQVVLLRGYCREEGWDSATVEIHGIGRTTVDYCPVCVARSGKPASRKEGRK